MADLNEMKLLIRLPNQHVLNFRSPTRRSAADLIGITGGKVEALFPDTSVQFVGGKNDWVVFQPDTVEDIHPWDRAHKQALSIVNSASGVGDVYVEPNIIHKRTLDSSDAGVRSSITPLSAQEDVTLAPPYPPTESLNPNYPPSEGASFSPAWHLQKAGFPRAWQTTKGEGIRIAHLDIGWWPNHYSAPLKVRKDLGYNFVEGNSNTVDPGVGPNKGHGTATLALLAGNAVSLCGKAGQSEGDQVYRGFIGGAPSAEIVPVRIAGVDGSVVYLYGETMARGLAYAINPGDGRRCDVVSLSHGGLPMKSWAHAVNMLYDAGVVVVAAAGDSYWAVLTDIATHFTVYPSAFYRVVTSTGVTFDDGPYKRDRLGVMQGCWGPDKVMKKAVGAYTPNVPWMCYNTKYGWDMNGAGTSASTPQMAAACALWLAKYGSVFPNDWRRVAACRAALGRSVADAEKDFSEIGLGRLDVSAMIEQTLADEVKHLCDENRLQNIDPDDVSFPFLRLLFGLAPPGNGIEEMYEVEALQIFYQTTNERLFRAVEDYENERLQSNEDLSELRAQFLQEKGMSDALRGYLTSHA